MYPDPLTPGQEFSFVNLVYAIVSPTTPSILVLVTPEAYESASVRKLLISPDKRLIVRDGCLDSDAWVVHGWLEVMARPVSFRQRLARGIARTFLQSLDPVFEGTSAVTNVRWPQPTPKSLAIQVRVLSIWPPGNGQHPNVHYLSWDLCQQLAQLPLEQGLTLALAWLQPFVADPAAALRERGFAV